MVAFTTYDRQVHHGFVNLVDFAKLLPGTNFWRRSVWKFVRFGKKLSSRDKPSALVKCWWWWKICLNKQFCRQCGWPFPYKNSPVPHVSQKQCKAHMWKSVCVHPWTLKIYQVEGTVLVSVRIFDNKMNTYRLKRWNVRTTCKAVNCFSNSARVKYSIVTSHLHLYLPSLSR